MGKKACQYFSSIFGNYENFGVGGGGSEDLGEKYQNISQTSVCLNITRFVFSSTPSFRVFFISLFLLFFNFSFLRFLPQPGLGLKSLPCRDKGGLDLLIPVNRPLLEVFSHQKCCASVARLDYFPTATCIISHILVFYLQHLF